MCLGTVGQVTTAGAAGCVEVDDGVRVITASLLSMTDAVAPGDWVLMHSGLVLGLLTEQEAKDALELRSATNERVRGMRHPRRRSDTH
jgi:hydrogenase maturation factor